MTGTPLLPAGQVKTLPAEGGLVLAVRPGPTPRSATFFPDPLPVPLRGQCQPSAGQPIHLSLSASARILTVAYFEGGRCQLFVRAAGLKGLASMPCAHSLRTTITSSRRSTGGMIMAKI